MTDKTGNSGESGEREAGIRYDCRKRRALQVGYSDMQVRSGSDPCRSGRAAVGSGMGSSCPYLPDMVEMCESCVSLLNVSVSRGIRSSGPRTRGEQDCPARHHHHSVLSVGSGQLLDCIIGTAWRSCSTRLEPPMTSFDAHNWRRRPKTSSDI